MSNFQAELPSTGVPSAEPTLFGQPIGLYVLFFTEMWERFSYYGMRALLTLYMVNYLSKPEIGAGVLGYSAIQNFFGNPSAQALSSQIYGNYTALVYLTPFLGGILADRIIGQRKTVVLGGVLMACGHFLMAIESFFFPALLLIILGNGCFKPNVSTQVGGLYPQGDPRRDGAYGIFYVGINLGAFFAPLVCGTLGQTMGWHYGFSAAGIGMVVGLIVYIAGQKYLAPDNLMEMKANQLAGKTEKQPLTRSEWVRIGGLMALCVLNVFFWAVYEQQGNTIALWADKLTDRHIFGTSWEMPSTWFQSVNPFFIFAFTPFLTLLWNQQASRGKETPTVNKMALGLFFVALSYMVMFFSAKTLTGTNLTSAWYLIGFFVFLTIGELYVSPVGLSLVTKVSPPRIVSMMMGLWFLSVFGGNSLGGNLGTLWEKMPKENFFLLMTGIALATSLAIWAFSSPLKKAMSHQD
ncbi:MAG: peptide MFS transporter [Anaerolineae bacterium]|nr:peptide MFS transporter [Gloeobacterales cyanobacterium ES-bin-313]